MEQSGARQQPGTALSRFLGVNVPPFPPIRNSSS